MLTRLVFVMHPLFVVGANCEPKPWYATVCTGRLIGMNRDTFLCELHQLFHPRPQLPQLACGIAKCGDHKAIKMHPAYCCSDT